MGVVVVVWLFIFIYLLLWFELMWSKYLSVVLLGTEVCNVTGKWLISNFENVGILIELGTLWNLKTLAVKQFHYILFNDSNKSVFSLDYTSSLTLSILELLLSLRLKQLMLLQMFNMFIESSRYVL